MVQLLVAFVRVAVVWLGRILWRYAVYWLGSLLSRLVGQTVVSLWQVARLVVLLAALVGLLLEVSSVALGGVWSGVSYYLNQPMWREWFAYLAYLCGLDFYLGILIGWWRYYVIAICVVWLIRLAARFKWV